MPNRPQKVPSYRLHKPTKQAVVRLDGRDVYLGQHGSDASQEKYRRVVAEWLATAGHRPSETPPPSMAEPHPPSVAEVLLAFWSHAKEHYRGPDGTPSEEMGNLKAALRPVSQLYGLTLARDFGPLALRAVRDRMVADGLARTSVNARVNRIRRAFRWAASVELVPVAVVHALGTVAGLQKGRTGARETEPVGPVAMEVVEATLPELPRPIAAMVQLQLLTGMRPGEACAMRGRNLTPGEPTWTYRPASHKTAWRGRKREIPLGPKAQALIREFLKPDAAAFLFDPRQAVAEHHARRAVSRKSRPSPSEKAKRANEPGSGHARGYNRSSYLNAVRRACDRAFPHPSLSRVRRSKLTDSERSELLAWRKAHRWHPNQLRHTAATLIRSKFGLDVAQAVLGHAKADTTEIYAARDLARASEVLAEIG